jgi:hypothetical protein
LAPSADLLVAAFGVLDDLVTDRADVLVALLVAPDDRLPDLVAGRLAVLIVGIEFPLTLRPPRRRDGAA